MKKGTVAAGMAGAAISGKPDFFDEPDFGDEPMIPGAPKNPSMVFSTAEIAEMTFAELAEQAMFQALKGRRGTAERILNHDFHEKINQERVKMEQTAREAKALVQRAFQAIDADSELTLG